MTDSLLIDFREHRRFVVAGFTCRSIINSAARLTREFSIRFNNGAEGRGSAPRGETLSCFENPCEAVLPEHAIKQLEIDEIAGVEFSQLEFDRYLESRLGELGTDNVY